jgi:hypothetical protein
MEYGTMAQQPESKICNGCGEGKSNKKMNDTGLCTECAAITEAIKKNPILLGRIATLVQPGVSQESSDPTKMEQPRELPEVLDAVRFRTRDRELNTWYVSVSELDGNPVEIFASTAFDRDQHLQSRISNLTTITR